ncbi:ABC transporter substrate-binding protein [Acetanaerobacterium elongatum]|uniref:Iron complex transport system substrate-binding protein n=1 Tax=Acetanaerobacterium elongatum TaxID=258515 RepID=A0A1H0D6U4_9FIRM|nr:helical backbone metal receptor [Acetanaerobacterium elongatum]SDN65904.1 iron complex transport system substrate-binding protein [Acetanaerobacterium elongatum]
MIKKIAAAVLGCVVLVSFASCSIFEGNGGNASNPGGSEVSSAPIDVNYPLDMDGIYIEKMPQRVVSLSPALTEMVSILGYENRLVGRTDYCDYPSSVSNLPTVGSPIMLDTAKIKELKPDLILMQVPTTNEALTQMQQTGAAIVTLPKALDINSTAELYSKIFKIMEGAEAGAAKGEEYKARFLNRVTALTQATQSAAAANTEVEYTAAYIIDTVSIAATTDTYEGKLFSILGLTNVAGESVNWNYPLENLAKAKPYVLLCGSGIDIESLSSLKKFKGLSAVKKGRAYKVETAAIERQSPRMLDELERLAKEIYPDIQLSGSSAAPGASDAASEASSGKASSATAA